MMIMPSAENARVYMPFVLCQRYSSVFLGVGNGLKAGKKDRTIANVESMSIYMVASWTEQYYRGHC